MQTAGITQLPLQVTWLRATLYKCAVIMCTDRLELLLPEDETTEEHCDRYREWPTTQPPTREPVGTEKEGDPNTVCNMDEP